MNVYSIKTEINKISLLLPASPSDSIYETLDFNGTSKESDWHPMEFYIDNPLAEQCSFYSLIMGSAFVCDKLAVDKFGFFFNQCAELLPIFLKDGKELFIVNVIDVPNALDYERTEFDSYKDGTKGRILKYAFHSNRIHESSIFKIPETANTQILTYTGIKSQEDEFYGSYKQSGFEGLSFQLLYSDLA